MMRSIKISINKSNELDWLGGISTRHIADLCTFGHKHEIVNLVHGTCTGSLGTEAAEATGCDYR